MNPAFPEPDPQEPDPFAVIPSNVSDIKPKKQPAIIITRIIAFILFIIGVAVTGWGGLMAYGEKTGWEPPFPNAGRVVIGAGIFICGVAFALYDRRGPFSFLRRIR